MSASVLRVNSREAAASDRDLKLIQAQVQKGDWLSTGDRGADVEALQRGLKARGFYNGPVDGDFGPVTKAAVQGYQRANGLVADGAVGPQTLADLKRSTLKVADRFEGAPAVQGQAGSDIRRMEQRLHALGYDTGKVDGVFDAATQAAVRSYRRRDAQLRDNVPGMTQRFESEIMKADAPKAPPGSQVNSTPPPSDYTRVNFRGATVNKRTQVMIERAEAEMAKLGHPGFKFSISQGSYNTSVSASAGTHDGGGALDIRTAGMSRDTVNDMVVAMRRAGFAAWSRGRGFDSFSPHIHAIAIGDRELSSSARNQVREYFAGGDGLVGTRSDPDGFLGRPFPAWAAAFR